MFADIYLQYVLSMSINRAHHLHNQTCVFWNKSQAVIVQYVTAMLLIVLFSRVTRSRLHGD